MLLDHALITLLSCSNSLQEVSSILVSFYHPTFFNLIFSNFCFVPFRHRFVFSCHNSASFPKCSESDTPPCVRLRKFQFCRFNCIFHRFRIMCFANVQRWEQHFEFYQKDSQYDWSKIRPSVNTSQLQVTIFIFFSFLNVLKVGCSWSRKYLSHGTHWPLPTRR